MVRVFLRNSFKRYERKLDEEIADGGMKFEEDWGDNAMGSGSRSHVSHSGEAKDEGLAEALLQESSRQSSHRMQDRLPIT